MRRRKQRFRGDFVMDVSFPLLWVFGEPSPSGPNDPEKGFCPYTIPLRVQSTVQKCKCRVYIYIYMFSILGIVIMALGVYSVFGYLDP